MWLFSHAEMQKMQRIIDVMKTRTQFGTILTVAVIAAVHAERLRLGGLELGFTVELGMAGTNAVVSFDERAMASFREETSGGRRVGVWKGHPICGADFEVRAEAEKGNDGSWRYSYSYAGNSSDRFLRRVKFPELSAPVDARADVLVPYSMGMLVHCDWFSAKNGAPVWFGARNGDFRAFRFAALVNEGGGNPSVYLDWRTDGYASSNVQCHKDREGFARIAVFYDLPFTDEARSRAVRPFVGVIREYNGSWWNAARFYREWAVTRPYYAEAKARAAKRGRLRDVSMWFWNRGEAECVIAPVEKFAADAGVPVALDWYWWHKIPYDTCYPNFWPPREGVEKFRATIERAKRSGIYTQVYINGVSRGEDDPDWVNGGEAEALWWDPVRSPGRSPRRVVYNPYSNVALVEMCGEAPVFQAKIREVVRHLVRDGGLEAVYVDQIVCACNKQCFNPCHSHAPGDSDAIVRGYVDFIRTLRAENPGVHFSSEDIGEDYIGMFDSHIILCDSMERYGWWKRRMETVPAFQAVFNDVAVLFGAYTMMDGIPPYDVNWPLEKKWKRELDWPALFPDQFAVELARSAIHGMQPCVHNFRLENASDPRLKDDYAFMVATARWRHENADFLADALLADPGRLESAAKTAKFCSRSTYNAEGKYNTIVHEGIPAVMHSVWRGKDGSVRAMFVNWTRENQRYRLSTPDVSLEGTLPPRTWKTVASGK